MFSTLKRGEISTVVILGTLAVIGVATFLTSTLSNRPQEVGTRAQGASCPYNSGQGVQTGATESNANNMEPRMPISQHRHEYDFFSYFEPASFEEAASSGQNVLSKDQYLSFTDAAGAVDSKMNGFMGRMFGYKPNRLADAYFMKYRPGTPRGADTLVKGSAPALRVPTNPGDPVMMPDTGYSIGGNMEAMVVFAASDRITLHIGRHEYFAGTGGNNCNGGPCSGGYWIYIRGICVDQQIVNKYNEIKGAQEAAAADKNPIQLPMVEANRILGRAAGNSVEVVVRDNGPLISVFKPVYWQGVSERDVGGAPTIPPTVPATIPPIFTPGPTILITGFPTQPPTQVSVTVSPQVTLPVASPTPMGCGRLNNRCCNPSDGVNQSCLDAGTNCANGYCITCGYEGGPCCGGVLCDSNKMLMCDYNQGGICKKIGATPTVTPSQSGGTTSSFDFYFKPVSKKNGVDHFTVCGIILSGFSSPSRNNGNSPYYVEILQHNQTTNTTTHSQLVFVFNSPNTEVCGSEAIIQNSSIDTVLMIIDPDNKISETNKTNNVMYYSSGKAITPKPQPTPGASYVFQATEDIIIERCPPQITQFTGSRCAWIP